MAHGELFLRIGVEVEQPRRGGHIVHGRHVDVLKVLCGRITFTMMSMCKRTGKRPVSMAERVAVQAFCEYHEVRRRPSRAKRFMCGVSA
ncbi:MAG: hypothetical protein WA376_09970, partial [Terrimicrobiaceae bacterium]